MDSNGNSQNRAAPNRLDDVRMSNYDRLIAQRHLDAGAALADVALDVSHRIRSAMVAIGTAFRAAMAHRRADPKDGVAHFD